MFSGRADADESAKSSMATVVLIVGVLAIATAYVPKYRFTRNSLSRSERPLQDGWIALVGAGPGDPQLLTLRAVDLIENATLVIADKLIPQDILSLVKCRLLVSDWKHGNADTVQAALNSMVLDAIRQGERVVRLKIGDPFVFGRGAEEVLEYRKYGVEPIIVPGVSSALAAPAAAGIPVTHRNIAQRILICTGYGRNGTHPDLPTYDSKQTVVLLMAVGKLDSICRELIEKKGFPGSTAVSIIEDATMPSQRVIAGPLNSIAETAKVAEVRAPAVVVIGAVNEVLK